MAMDEFRYKDKISDIGERLDIARNNKCFMVINAQLDGLTPIEKHLDVPCAFRKKADVKRRKK